MRQSCSDSLPTASHLDMVFGSDNGAMLPDTPIVRRPGSSAPPPVRSPGRAGRRPHAAGNVDPRKGIFEGRGAFV